MDFGHLVGLLLDERREPLVICRLETPVALAIGAKSFDVLLSHYTVCKQLERHADLVAEDYRALPLAIQFGEVRLQAERTALVLYTDVVLNRNFRAAIKATQDGSEVYCVSFNKLRDRHLKKDLRKPYPLIRPHN